MTAAASPRTPPLDMPNDAPLCWSDWSGARHRHAGANDRRLRASEPDLPDGDAKYLVLGGAPPTGCLCLADALERIHERDEPADRVVAVGSRRPIVAWGISPHRKRVLRVDHVGASAEESRICRESGLLHESGSDHVILRVRMRRSTLERIRRAAEHVRVRSGDPEGRQGKFMSTWVVSILLDALAQLEAEVSAVQAAGFTGRPPRDIS